MDKSFWVIEQPGPSYLAVRYAGGHHFVWSDDIRNTDGTTVLRFHDEASAISLMLNVRAICGDLFPTVLPHQAKAVEHSWIGDNEPSVAQTATAVQRALE